MKKYLSQEEAEALVEWTNKNNEVYLGGSTIVRKEFEKAEEIRLAIWDKVFGEKSVWSVKRTPIGKLVVIWDKEKAKNII